jgi:hypothetical protein
MSINRGEALSVTPSGALSIATSVGRIEQRELYAYQEIAGVRHQVKCSFVVDGSGNVYINGSTSSTDFPTTSGAFQTSLVGNVDVTVTKLNSNGTLGARMKDEG